MRIGFIGTGNMGGAILSGYINSGTAEGNEILVCDQNEETKKHLKEEFADISLYENADYLVKNADIAVVGVKPQIIGSVLEGFKGAYSNEKLIVSMAAGIKIEFIEKILGEDAQIIRIMPNTPAKVGEAMTAVCRNKNTSERNFEEAMKMFTSIGRAEEVDEELIDCVTGVSGSSPAYTYMYIEALAKGAVENGMSEEKAKIFAAQSVLGAAKMALESDESLEQLRINVCSPNGTTIEAVNKLMENGFMDKVREGFQAAVDRSIEMSEEKR